MIERLSEVHDFHDFCDFHDYQVGFLSRPECSAEKKAEKSAQKPVQKLRKTAQMFV